MPRNGTKLRRDGAGVGLLPADHDRSRLWREHRLDRSVLHRGDSADREPPLDARRVQAVREGHVLGGQRRAVVPDQPLPQPVGHLHSAIWEELPGLRVELRHCLSQDRSGLILLVDVEQRGAEERERDVVPGGRAIDEVGRLIAQDDAEGAG